MVFVYDIPVKKFDSILKSSSVRNSHFSIEQFKKNYDDKSMSWCMLFNDSGQCTAAANVKTGYGPASNSAYVNELQSLVSGGGYGKKMLMMLKKKYRFIWLCADPSVDSDVLLKFYRDPEFNFTEYVIPAVESIYGKDTHVFAVNGRMHSSQWMSFLKSQYTEQCDLNESSGKIIEFPDDEIPQLKKRYTIITHRVSDDARRFKVGDILHSPQLDAELEVKNIRHIDDISLSPFIKMLSPAQRKFISKFDDIAVIRLQKLGQYEPPYSLEQIKANYPEETYIKLSNDPVHRWRAQTGIELIHKEPSEEEQVRIWNNWQLMPDKLKKISDKKSYELFGVDNAEHYRVIKLMNDSFKHVLDTYKDRFGIDLSYMHFKTSKQPVRTDGEPCFDFKPEECAGDCTTLGWIRMNPDLDGVKCHYGIDSMSDEDFTRIIFAHELAHEIWNNHADERLKSEVLEKARKAHFTTPYLKTVKSDDLPVETFCEWLANEVCKQDGVHENRVLGSKQIKAYRFLYDGAGIYEGVKTALFNEFSPRAREKWSEVLAASSWLTKPDFQYSKEYESWFTLAGKTMFEKTVLPIIEKIGIDGIEMQKSTIDSRNIVYSDIYQAIVKLDKINEDSHQFYDIDRNDNVVSACTDPIGKIGISTYDDINAAGIGSFEIFKPYRRMGHAKKVLQKLVQKLKSKYDLVYCFVDKDNYPALSLYKQLGKVSNHLNADGQYEVEFWKTAKDNQSVASKNIKSLFDEVVSQYKTAFGIEDESIIKCDDHLNENKATYLQKYKDEDDAAAVVDMFWAIRNRLSAPQNDIDWWIKKPFQALKDFVQSYDPSNKRQRRDIEYRREMTDNDAKMLGSRDGYEIWYVPTYEAMRTIGRFYKGVSTQWCVSSDDPSFWFDMHDKSEFIVLVRENLQHDEFDKLAIEMQNGGRAFDEDEFLVWDVENEDDRACIDDLMHYAWELFIDNGERRQGL